MYFHGLCNITATFSSKSSQESQIFVCINTGYAGAGVCNCAGLTVLYVDTTNIFASHEGMLCDIACRHAML